MWRVLHGILPSSVGPFVDVVETTEHALRDCDWVRQFWEMKKNVFLLLLSLVLAKSALFPGLEEFLRATFSSRHSSHVEGQSERWCPLADCDAAMQRGVHAARMVQCVGASHSVARRLWR